MTTHRHILGTPYVPDNDSGGASSRGPHRLASANRCQVQWDLRYRRGFRILKEPPWRLSGSLFHLYSAYWWAGKMVDPPDWSLMRKLEDEEAHISKGRDEERDSSRVMFEQFKVEARKYSWEPIAVEGEVSATLEELYRHVGKSAAHLDASMRNEVATARLDLVARTGPKRGAVIDYKTKGGTGKQLARFNPMRDFVLDWQFDLGLMIARVHFRREMNLRIGPMIVLRAKREPPYHFSRNIVKPKTLPYQGLPLLVEQSIRREREIVDRRERRLPLLQDGIPIGACASGAWTCDYKDVCAVNTLDDRRAILERNYES